MLALCQECGKSISSEAETCPHCGVTTPRTKQLQTRTVIYLPITFAALLISALYLNACSSDATALSADCGAQMASTIAQYGQPLKVYGRTGGDEWWQYKASMLNDGTVDGYTYEDIHWSWGEGQRVRNLYATNAPA